MILRYVCRICNSHIKLKLAAPHSNGLLLLHNGSRIVKSKIVFTAVLHVLNVSRPAGKNHSVHRLLIGTHTDQDKPNYLQIAHVELPTNVQPDVRNYDEQRGEVGGYGASSNGQAPAMKMTIEQRIDHPGEVNKARYQPQNPNIIATMTNTGDVLIFDKSKHSSVPKGTPNPQIVCKGHTAEGFGLCWNPHEAGKLATGSSDDTVRLW
jgi:histone-binding protein RBBP4